MKETPREWFTRIRVACGVIEAGINSGALSLAELDMDGLLASADDYTKKVVGMLQLDTVDASLHPKNRNVVRAFAVAYGEYLDFVMAGMDQGKKLVYHFFEVSPQICIAMDMIPVCVETITILMAALFNDGCEEEIDTLEAEGFPAHLCSGQKGFVGAYLSGGMPAPDYFLKPSVPCDPSNMLFQYMAKLTGAPYVIIDAPYYTNKRAFDYYRDETINAYKELGEMSGNKLDEDKLRHAVQRTNEQLKYIYKLQELRKITPCPDPAMHRAMDFALYTLFGFSEKVVDYFRIVHDEARERADKGLGVIPEDKKEIRTLWTWAFEGYDLSIYHWMEEEYGATYTECGLTFLPEDQIGLIDEHDPDFMMAGLARLTFNYPMSRQVTSYADIWINDFTELAKSHQADCAIFAGHMACKHGWALNKLLSDAIRDEADIPTLRFEVDLADKRFTPPAEVKKTMAEFFETVKR